MLDDELSSSEIVQPQKQDFTKDRETCIRKASNYYFVENQIDEMVSYVRCMNTAEEKRRFLTRRKLVQQLLKIELENKNYDYVANIYEQQGKYTDAALTLEKREEGINNEKVNYFRFKVFRMKYFDSMLLRKPLLETKQNKKSYTDELMKLLKLPGTNGHPIEIEIKFWLNGFDDIKLLDWNKTREKLLDTCPSTIYLKLTWWYIRSLLRSIDINSSPAVSWHVLKKVIQYAHSLGDTIILALIEKVIGDRSNVLDDTEEQQLLQTLDIFGLRSVSLSNCKLLTARIVSIEDFPAIKEFWQSIDPSTLTEVSFRKLLSFVNQHIRTVQDQDEKMLQNKADKILDEEIFQNLLSPEKIFLRFRAKMNRTATSASSMSYKESLNFLKHLSETAHRKQMTTNNSQLVYKKACLWLLDEIFFPLCPIFADIVEKQSLCAENVELFQHVLHIANESIDRRIDHKDQYDFEKLARDVLLLDYFPQDCGVIVSNYLIKTFSSAYSNCPFNTHVKKLWKGKSFEYQSYNRKISSIASPDDLFPALTDLIEAQSLSLKFLSGGWKDENSPLFFQRKMLSPFTFLQLAERTIFMALFIRKCEETSLFIPEHSATEFFQSSPMIRHHVQKVIAYYRHGYKLPLDTKEKLAKNARGLISSMLEILSSPWESIEQWFKFAAIGSQLHHGRTAQTQNRETYNCFYLRLIHLMLIFRFNTGEFSTKMNKDYFVSFCKRNQEKLLFPENYLNYLKTFDGRVIRFIPLCHELGDPLLELRVDTFKKDSESRVMRLKKRILHCDVIKSMSPAALPVISFITEADYDLWEKAQPSRSSAAVTSTSVIMAEDQSSKLIEEVKDEGEEKEEDVILEDEVEDPMSKYHEKFIQLAILAKEKRYRKLSKVQLYQRKIEKEEFGSLRRNDPIVLFYVQEILPTYYQWIVKDKPLLEKVGEIIEVHGDVIKSHLSFDEVYDMINLVPEVASKLTTQAVLEAYQAYESEAHHRTSQEMLPDVFVNNPEEISSPNASATAEEETTANPAPTTTTLEVLIAEEFQTSMREKVQTLGDTLILLEQMANTMKQLVETHTATKKVSAVVQQQPGKNKTKNTSTNVKK